MASAPNIGTRIGASGHPLTREQERIISMPPNKTRKWVAFAGCAKTSTLVEYSYAWRDPAIYLAFNSAIAGDAKGRFPGHIHTQTAHGYAFIAMSVQVHKDRLVQRLRPEHFEECRELLRPVAKMTELAVRRAINKSLNAYLISDDAHIDESHLRDFPYAVRPACVSMVAAVVERIMDFENSGMAFTHDIYLKAFALRGHISDRFHYLMLDEAQDLNPVLIGIANRSGRPITVVGDPYQSIYLFRGASNAIEEFSGDRFTLSKSFRFGPEIAAVANFILKQSISPPDIPIVGNELRQSRVREYRGVVNNRSTILARTNLRLFESLVKVPHPFHVVGGVEDMISQVAAGYSLWKGLDRAKTVIDPIVSRHRTWADLVEASETEEEPETVRLVKIIETYRDAIPGILEDLRRRNCKTEDEARIIVSTAHKAKGREWQTVIVLDDFLTPFQLRQRLARKNIKPQDYNQEINLLYVTLTRAIETLMLSSDLYDEIAAGTGLPRI